MMRLFKNLVGNLLGYARCSITGDSLFGNYETIWYTESRGVLISRRAARLPPQELAERVYRFVVEDGRASASETSPERIMHLNGSGRADSPFAVEFQDVEICSSARYLRMH